jgi:3-dehydroquinate synthetase
LRGTLALSGAMPERDRALRLVERLRVDADRALDARQQEAAMHAMTRDKKVRRGSVRFVVLERIGAPKLLEATAADCARALAAALA